MKSVGEKKVILDSEQIERALKRIAHEIRERNLDFDKVVIVGIRTRGVTLAGRLVEYIKEIYGVTLATGILDINLYRDDLTSLSEQPIIHQTIIPSGVTGKTIILVDDVLYTGRTIRAALDSIIDLGRPNSIQLVALIDRGHRELPIRADYVGKNVPTSKKEQIIVMLNEDDGEEKVLIGLRGA